MKKRYIVLLIIMFIALVASIVYNLVFVKDSDITSKAVVTPAPIIQTNLPTPTIDLRPGFDDNYISAMETFDKFSECINNKDFKTAYDIMDQSYLEYFEINYDTFVGKYDDIRRSFNVIKALQKNDNYIIYTNMYEEGMDPEEGTELPIEKREFTIIKNDDGDYKIIDIGILDISEINKTATKNNVDFSVLNNIITTKGENYISFNINNRNPYETYIDKIQIKRGDDIEEFVTEDGLINKNSEIIKKIKTTTIPEDAIINIVLKTGEEIAVEISK